MKNNLSEKLFALLIINKAILASLVIVPKGNLEINH